MPQTDLTAIRTKVRRLTRSPSQAQITDAEINEYINTFVLFDFPGELRLWRNLDRTDFFSDPFMDRITVINNTNGIITIEPPIYIDGRQAWFTQSVSEFYSAYPKNASDIDTGLRGNGIATNFVGTLAPQVPVLRNEVLFTSIATLLGEPLGVELSDVGGLGVLSGTGGGFGTINYVTGAFNLTFGTAPDLNEPIIAHVVPYTAGRPDSVLFFNTEIILRPVPDQTYKIEIQTRVRPDELLANNQSPELHQWWQYIAYGAAKKIFEDRMDLDSVAQILPELKKQERLALRTTIVQQTNDRVATIYTEQIGGYGPGYYRGGGLN
jgi:hypothetical protein